MTSPLQEPTFLILTALAGESLHGYGVIQEVSRLSPSLVRNLLDRAREEYDVIVVDTGPILGSLEASLVTAESDGVVMALEHGTEPISAVQFHPESIMTLGGDVGLAIVENVMDMARAHREEMARVRA